jgi:DNA polymerase
MCNKQAEIKKLYNELVALTRSPLYDYRQKNNFKPVIGAGNPDAKIIFVGEAPGENEAKTGVPFSGAAGKILDELLKSVAIDRSSVFITNIVNDRPPGNRDPLPEELELYSPFLKRLLKIIKPKIIATLGRFSMKYILELCQVPQASQPISQLHGQTFTAQTSYGQIYIIPLYHPAVALYNANQKKTLLQDMKTLQKLAEKAQ